MVTEQYLLENLNCADCANQIEAKINALKEVDSARVDFIKRTLTVRTKGYRELEHNIKRIVKSVEPDIKVQQITQEVSKPGRNIPWVLISGGLGIIVYIIGKQLHLPDEYKIFIYLSAYLLSSWHVLYNAVVKAFGGRLLDEHFLMSVASLGAVYLGEYPEAIAVMLLYEIGQFLENKAVNHSRDSIQGLLKLKPDLVHRLVNDHITDVPIRDMSINELLLVLPGERVPLDGEVVSGESSLDTSALTGEALPLDIGPGSIIMSGCLNQRGKFTLKVQSTDQESTVSRIMRLVEDATQRKSRTERFVTRFARKYTPSVVLLAILIAVLMPVLTVMPFSVWFKRALIFLVISCPCALVISIPLTNYAAIGAAARRGILLKGSNFIDALARTTAFVYDKTGTLTTGKLSVLGITPVEEVSPERVIKAALICEEGSLHPISQAVHNKFSGQMEVEPSLMFQEYRGLGVRAQTSQANYYAGNRNFMKEWDILNIPEEPSETCIFLAEGNQCLGYITFQDEVREGFKKVIPALKRLGVRKHIMLTGDHATQAQKVADSLHLTAYHARLLPEDKTIELEKIEQSQKQPVAFIGDGLNDAPVISRAEIGIAMGAGGNQAAIEAADVVLMKDEPEQLLEAVKMAKRTRNIMWQNIIFALGIKVVVMTIGTMGLANLWEAVIADVGVTLLAVGNSLRLLRS